MSSNENSIQVQVGLRIKSLRALRALSQEDLAVKTSMFRSYISRIESGLANPTLTTLNVLASALGVNVVELLAPIDPQRNAVNSPRSTKSK